MPEVAYDYPEVNSTTFVVQCTQGESSSSEGSRAALINLVRSSRNEAYV